jgi:imidazolonepropionase
VASEGGGILRTLAYTREATPEELLEQAAAELERFQQYGVGTIEIKSGYGLSWESELKILECIQKLQETSSVAIVPTFLPAHATPPEYRGKTDQYVDLICQEWIPAVAEKELATFFDVFIENGYFDLAQAEKLCRAALEHDFKLKLHCDQFTEMGGTALGVELGAQSVDHLDQVSDAGIQRVAGSDTVAVLCPGASLFTGTPFPRARQLIDAGARVALSTDFNPGTCPSRNLPLMTTIACSQMKMTVAEAIAAVTYNAAAALGMEGDLGSLEVGKAFRACQLKAESFEILPYCFGELG